MNKIKDKTMSCYFAKIANKIKQKNGGIDSVKLSLMGKYLALGHDLEQP